ncbi:MAG TPA: ROK family protein [Verrucomicrobiae bacterium]
MYKIDLNNFQVATSETARDINSRIILNLVRERQPISRADLMRDSGLQRSSVSVITKQLIKNRWLLEGTTGKLPRGRRPTFLHLNENRAGIFGINIQPCVTELALANLSGHFLVRETFPTPRDAATLVAQVSRCIRDWMAKYPRMNFEDIGVSVPGRINLFSQKLVFAPNLGWHATDLKKQLESATGLTVHMENAANACALAEFWFGKHAENVRNLVVVTVSEGIGVGMILNNQLVRGSSGLAGEFGHVTINENGPRCSCGNYGCWEMYASNTAAVRHYNESKSRGARKGSVKNFSELLQLVDQGDAAALETLTYMAEYLGAGIAMLVTGFAPNVIAVVGDVTTQWNRINPVMAEVIRKRVSTHAAVKIVPSVSQPPPRLKGSIALILQKHFTVPIGI